MNILPMLARLAPALGRTDLTEQMVLIPQRRSAKSVTSKSKKEVNLIVGYNGSPSSQAALDLTLWIAHQTRLATSKHVTVQVVYVVNLEDACSLSLPFACQSVGKQVSSEIVDFSHKGGLSEKAITRRSSGRNGGAIAELPEVSELSAIASYCQNDQFEQADQILWQARHLADEWRGSLKTHLRFGQIAKEIRQVVEAESASVLLLGCESSENWLVKQLGQGFPCPVLGIPSAL